MPEVNTSLYPQAPEPLNPLQVGGQAAALVGQMNQNKLFNLNLEAKEAIGPIYQRSIGPDGQIDTNKLLTEASKDPRTAWMAGQLAGEAQERASAQLQIQREKIGLAVDQNKAAAGYMAKIGADPTKKNVINTISEGIAAGYLTPQKGAELYGTLPEEDSPEKIKAWLLPHQLQAMEVGERLNAVYGTLMEIDTGAEKVVTRAGALVPGGPGTAAFNKTLSPGEAVEQVRIYNPDTKAYEYISKGDLARRGGRAGSPRGSGQPSPQTAGPLMAEPPLGAAEAAAETGGQSGKALATLRESVAQSGPRIFQLQQAADALSKTDTGPGTEVRQDLQSALLAIPGIRDIDIKALNDIKDDSAYYDKARKYLTNYAMAQASTLGAGTDEKLTVALTANPSVHISNMAAQDLVKMNIGLERYRQAQAQAFDASRMPPEDFHKWSVQWNKDVDPRAFVVDSLDKAKREAMFKSMSKNEKSAFVRTHKWIKANGYAN